MGLSKRCSSSPYAVPNSNPDPQKFVIEEETYYKGHLILKVYYPNCTNYEGRKLMVYKGFSTSKQLLAASAFKLDPHFTKSPVSPIARFAPTEESLAFIKKMLS